MREEETEEEEALRDSKEREERKAVIRAAWRDGSAEYGGGA